ncbi:hypothetical protein WICPIJ_007701 [Wickerhamomyces pijperi]|uniref:Glucosidase 2 subunit beta n=1 Tax=Wickerhamomyces pijperi TaxID=599730 RepID=A0A9P8TJ04_WICPI|nr:hypothetical protein WICPIJ_007701 [Wickerhamomyces pijperi]
MPLPNLLLLLLLPSSSLATAYINGIQGVQPSLQHLYKPNSNGQWTCLNHPEIKLSFSQINDNYCDCPDGSDEPGTSACANGQFYCANDGFKPQVIKSYLVNDGVCDYELCCDGSDEWGTDVVCPNRCDEMRVNEQQRKKKKIKEIKEGQLVLKKLMGIASAERLEIETQLQTKVDQFGEIAGQLQQLAQDPEYLKISKDRKEEVRVTQILDQIKQDVNHSFQIFISSKEYHSKLVEILKSLKETYNENLNDAAVKKTIEDSQYHFESYRGEYHADLNDPQSSPSKPWQKAKKILNSGFRNIVKQYRTLQNVCTHTLSKHNELIKRSAELEGMLTYLINNYNPNFNDLNVKSAVQSAQDLLSNKDPQLVNITVDHQFVDKLIQELSEIVKYVDTLDKEKPTQAIQYETVRPFLNLRQKAEYKLRKWINDFIGKEYNHNLVPIPEKDTQLGGFSPIDKTQQIQQQIDQLTQSQKLLNSEILNTQSKLGQNYGPNDILRIPRTIRSTISDYDYTISFMGDIKQSNSQKSVIKIGHFKSFQIEDLSDFEYQLRLSFGNGDRCWNGPIRKADVVVQCGAAEEIISVSELEKCQYEFIVKSPVGCKFIDEHALAGISDSL